MTDSNSIEKSNIQIDDDRELLDIYDCNAIPTGKTIIRGTPIKSGEYSLSVHLFIYNSKGLFLVQKRSYKKRSLPGIWSVTCGAVSAGEDSISAGIREAKEEVGLDITKEQFEFIDKIKRRHSFVDIFFIKSNFEISKLVLQEDEVDSVKLASPKELLNMIIASSNANSTYLASITRAMKERGLIQ